MKTLCLANCIFVFPGTHLYYNFLNFRYFFVVNYKIFPVFFCSRFQDFFEVSLFYQFNINIFGVENYINESLIYQLSYIYIPMTLCIITIEIQGHKSLQ